PRREVLERYEAEVGIDRIERIPPGWRRRDIPEVEERRRIDPRIVKLAAEAVDEAGLVAEEDAFVGVVGVGNDRLEIKVGVVGGAQLDDVLGVEDHEL